MLSLSAAEHDALCKNFFSSVFLQDSSVVALYFSKGRELDTQILIDQLLERNINVVLPVIQQGGRILKFAKYTHDTEMTLGAFDIMQPKAPEFIEPDIVIVPLLAFDQRGNRLGYGGGYYDATLCDLKKNKDIIAVGLGYAQQACLFALPAEEHDVKLDMVITEQSVHKF